MLKSCYISSFKSLTRSFHPSSCLSASEFSHLIVGAGSAGCVLANRLSADSTKSVCLLEAGPPDSKFNWKIHMPAALMYNLMDDKYNWYYHSVPQPHTNNRVMYWPRGRVWGGSSSLNAMVYIRGHALDYDRWSSEGATNWDYAHCLPYFRKAQTHQLGADEYRGGDGPLHVSVGGTSSNTNPLYQTFLKAAHEAGYPFTEDMNGYQQEGFGWMDMTIHKGSRWSTSKAYLKPVLERDNLKIKSRVLVTKLLFNQTGNKVTGLELLNTKNGTTEQIYAENVILSSGAINSPQLLLLSGIGPKKQLQSIGIDAIKDLPGVGQNLQDHLELYVQHKCSLPITLYSAQWKFPHNMIRIGLQWFLSQSGPAASSHLEAGGFIKSHPSVPHPDMQFHFLPGVVNDHGRKPGDCHAYQVHVGTMRPTSRGEITLKSKDPREHPTLDPNYLSTEEDIIGLRDSVHAARKILNQPAFDKYRREEIQPGDKVQSDKEIDAFVRFRCDSAYHPSCTCKMGGPNDEMAVVDPSTMKVFGFENLMVVDASVMPSMVSGNLNAATIMIAEKASDIILGNKPLPSSNASVYKI